MTLYFQKWPLQVRGVSIASTRSRKTDSNAVPMAAAAVSVTALAELLLVLDVNILQQQYAINQ